MIFDSPEMKDIREAYKELPLTEVPGIVKLDRLEEYQNERMYLEDLISRIEGPKQKDLLSKLVCCDDGQHIGAWFELMLFGWLRDEFKFEIGPIIEGCNPDFVIDLNGSPIAIEAKASLIPKDEKEKQVTENLIFSYVHEIPFPYFISIDVETISHTICKEKFIHDLTCWLQSGGSNPLLFFDEYGNKFTIIKGMEVDTPHLLVGMSIPLRSDLKKLMHVLHKKANQNLKIQEAGIPYVIAVFHESGLHSSEEIVSAWFGTPTLIVDRNGGGIIGHTTSRTGAQYAKNNQDKIVHKGVSGILGFSVKRNIEMKTRELIASYIQIPFAANPIAPDIFPVTSRFIIESTDENSYNMKWVNS
ncbi:MAG: hypothetical protein ABFD50_12395 [Smithella sp.]